MVRGNLILESETFRLPEEELILFAKRMENLIVAVDKCRGHGDNIYGKGDLSYTDFLGKPLYEYCDPETYDFLKDVIPDFSRDLHYFLTYDLLNYDNKRTICTNLDDLESSHHRENNGLIGPECDRFGCSPELTVFSEESWNVWKIAYLTKFPEYIDNDSITHPHLFNLGYSNNKLANISQSKFGSRYFYANAISLPPGGQRNALAIEVGRLIAEANYYQYNSRVSKLNNSSSHQRDIYSLNVGGYERYISIDVENIAFEVCNDMGQHLGAFKFDGSLQSNADTSGKHNIRV